MVTPPEVPADPVVRRYPRRLAARLGWSALALFCVPLLIELLLRNAGVWSRIWGIIAPYGSLLAAPALALVAGWLRVFGLGGRAQLLVEPGALVIRSESGKDQRIPIGDVQSGFAEPARNGATIEISLSGDRVLRTSAASLEEAEALLQRLGLDASQRRCRVSLASEGRRVLAGVLASFGWFMGTVWTMMAIDSVAHLPTPLPPPVLLLWMASWIAVPWLVMRLAKPTEVVIGAEGLHVRRGLRSKEIGYERIDEIEQTERGIAIRLVTGETLKIGQGWTEVDHNAAAIVHRVRRALDARRRSDLPATKLALLARDRRSIAAWRESLRALTQGTGGYRGLAMTVEDLGQVLESDAATAEQKVAAALALAGASPTEVTAKVRVAAERATNDRVRVALSAIAEGSDEGAAIDEALAAADDRGQPTPRSAADKSS